jgi:hypothetical protein
VFLFIGIGMPYQKHNPKLMRNILTNKKLLTKSVFRHTQYLQQLTVIVHACLPDTLREQCLVANCQRNELTLAAHSPAWSARLRYHGPAILKAVKNKTGVALRTMRIVIIPRAQHNPHRRIRTVNKPSQRSAALLHDTAEHIQHAELQQALMRLSRHMADRQNNPQEE